MKLYFTFSRLPELAGLTRPQRKAVLRCAMEALFAEQPSIMFVCSRWCFWCMGGGALAGWLAFRAGVLPRAGWWLIAAGALAGLALASLIGNVLITARLRPYCQRVRQERKAEIEQLGPNGG